MVFKLDIAAFNVKSFGKAKLNRAEVVKDLARIVHVYDIVLIQEIRDRDVTHTGTISRFLDEINFYGPKQVIYDVEMSKRLGSTRYKEQYAFFYKEDVVNVLEIYQHNGDKFERNPFSVLFKDLDSKEEFFLMGIHTKPHCVENELNALPFAFSRAADVFDTKQGVIMGDFNAGGRYLSEECYEELSLMRDPNFKWLIENDVDTTVAGNNCAYDRIVVHKTFNWAVVEGSAGVFDYSRGDFGLHVKTPMEISDHFPVEFTLST